jgi:sterol desaturase/sphingolipid hydroxylase (fatty acid hydroxylase superfamily)
MNIADLLLGSNVVNLLLGTGLSLLFLVAVFRPLELAYPAKKQRFFRPDWFTDLLFLLGQYLLWNALVFWCLVRFRGTLTGIVPHEFASAVRAQPFWLQVLGVILLSDFCVYWGHRLQHRWSFLWRFHSVHHSAEHLDWLAAHREHPLDTVYTLTLINLPAFVLGFPLETLAGFIAFRGVWAIYIHSNVRLPLGPLRAILGAPELHHWHHDRNRDAGNYGNVCPLMDLIFGTYVCPDHEPESFGINQPTPSTWFGYMIQPLLPRWRRAKPEVRVESGACTEVQSGGELQPTGVNNEQAGHCGRADACEVGQG